jgi:hypothetical protein
MTTKTTTNKQTNGTAKPPGILEEIRSLVEQQNSWKRALAAAETRLAEVEAQVDQARRKLADEESRHFAKHHEMLPDNAPPALGYRDAQVMLDRIRATCGGLAREISQHDVTLLSANERFQVYRRDYSAEAVKQFIKGPYAEAAKVWRGALRQAYALSAALGVAINERESQTDDTLSAAVLRPLAGAEQWQADPTAKTLHAQHAHLHQMGDALERHRIDSVRRVMAAEDVRRDRAGFDPTAQYLVEKRFVCLGEAFEVGAKVDSHRIRLALLEKLYSAKTLRMLERRDEYAR